MVISGHSVSPLQQGPEEQWPKTSDFFHSQQPGPKNCPIAVQKMWSLLGGRIGSPPRFCQRVDTCVQKNIERIIKRPTQWWMLFPKTRAFTLLWNSSWLPFCGTHRWRILFDFDSQVACKKATKARQERANKQEKGSNGYASLVTDH